MSINGKNYRKTVGQMQIPNEIAVMRIFIFCYLKGKTQTTSERKSAFERNSQFLNVYLKLKFRVK